ncbi:MAG TPA: CPBP family intramembrane glutamic endopeptidase, partial [Gemmatimonadaceae bacterium]|nr:CPBP family intramembrane glutamic endopeptidase [Gemmatimonadaceae bacterium]
MSEDQSRRTAASLAALAIAGVALGVWLFPHAFPTVALQQRVTRRLVLQRADSFFAANAIAPSRARTAVRFESDDALMTFVELAAGGDDTLNALVRGRDVAPFDWSVRAFVPGDVHEARVDFAPDGRLVGFSRTLAEADVRPPVSVDSGEAIARRILVAWLGESPARWRLATTSYETRKVSGRIDRTYTFERVSRRVGGAPIRLDIVIDGDTPADAAEYVQIPETFTRRYAQMRSANDAIEEGATLGILAIVIVGAIAFRRAARDGRIRWRGPLIVGGVVGSLLVAAALNDVPGSWFDYDTATSAAVFLIKSVITAVVGGVAMGVVVALTLAAAEAAERLAFPNHPDWWKLWSNRGTREIAGRVAGGYAVAAVDFAYVAFFYIVVRHYFGWWVPSELLDDPNQIATPMPWVTGIANSLQAGVWEESLFRALPLSILSVWVGTRPRRGWWMAAGVCVSALIFGCAHANYTS